MKILVTGHEGFVGRNLTRALVAELEDGDALYGIDIRSRDNIQEMTGPDLANEAIALASVAKNEPDVVVHLASSVSTPASIERPMETFRNTVRVGVNVIEACRLSMTPIIITSSVKARDAMTPYGRAKRMVEDWALEYADCYGLPVVINRPGTIYGPGQEGSPESGWVSWFLAAKKNGWSVVINGDGSQVRDLLHVSDYCALLKKQIYDFEKYRGGIWDVGGGAATAITVEQMARHLKLEYAFGNDRYGDSMEYVGVNDAPDWEPLVDWRKDEAFA